MGTRDTGRDDACLGSARPRPGAADFWLPSDPTTTADALREAWARAQAERVEIACGGGRGRAGTALACLAVLDGVPSREAVAYVREHYAPRAVETPWRRRFVTRFP
ncbi:dual specificity protein phosphatase [Streptomyces sp. C]|nr:dual specificity protein phosphatase [Streptomyces sp. C]